MQVTFPSYESYNYRELWRRINERETESLGFVKMPYEPKADEVLSPLSTRLTKQETITLEINNA